MVKMASNHCAGAGPSWSLSWGKDCSPHRAGKHQNLSPKAKGQLKPGYLSPPSGHLIPQVSCPTAVALPVVGASPKWAGFLRHRLATQVTGLCAMSNKNVCLERGPPWKAPAVTHLQVQDSDPELSEGSGNLLFIHPQCGIKGPCLLQASMTSQQTTVPRGLIFKVFYSSD